MTNGTIKKRPAMIAWHVNDKGDRHFWTRIGAAWAHDDGEGFTLDLHLIPVGSGRIVLRVPKATDEDAPDTDGGQA